MTCLRHFLTLLCLIISATGLDQTDPDQDAYDSKECALKCDKNSVEVKCPIDCPSDKCPTKAGESKKECPEVNSDICRPSTCKCIFNYSRANNGTCIPTRNCPPFSCDRPNEVYDPCPPLCPTDDCSQATPSGKCPLLGRTKIVLRCEPDCRCKKNYWRKNGTCVPYEQCNATNSENTCGPNEIVKKDPDCNSDCCPEPQGQPTACPDPCANACKCDLLYSRAQNGTCIPSRECPSIPCGENEVFESCPACSDSCENANPSGKRCPTIGKIGTTVICKPRCYCRDGYWRNDKNECVPFDQCPLKCDENSVEVKCPTDCPSDKCPTKAGESKKECPEVNSDICRPSTCKCIFNYSRAKNGTCIPTRNCPPFSCDRPNEVYDPCPPLCPTDDCSQATPSGKCPLLGRIGIVLRCKPDCRCKKNYWRKNGTCVPYEQCNDTNSENTCGPNEIIKKDPDCNSDCCPEPQGQPTACPDPCANACKCDLLYSRAQNGTCIPSRECSSIPCGENEVFESCPACSDSCENANPSGKRCPTIGKIGTTVICKPRCYCRDGYWRNDKNECVPFDQCPLKCDENSVEVKCPTDCPSDKCPTKAGESKKECPEVNSDICRPSTCKCIFNYSRAKNGTCIPTRNCPPFSCDGPNEVYDPCPPLCPTDDCSQATPSGKCPLLGRIGIVSRCKPDCRCKKNYWRKNGTCVPYEQCNDTKPQCLGVNESLQCVKECPPERTCETKDLQYKCANDNKECENKCVCNDGFFRTNNGQCVTSKSCDSENTCGPNEIVKKDPDCNSDCCPEPQGQPTACPDPCANACKCDIMYSRAQNGTCIPSRECPSIPCGENEVFESCPACSDSCENANPSGKRCPTIGKIGITVICKPRCYCRDGYWRNDKNECVPFDQCPLKCDDNSEEVKCPTDCPSDKCPTRAGESKMKCPKVKSDICRRSTCKCRFNYSRAKNGTCILTRECPPFSCAGPNEVYDPCPPLCPTDDCSQATKSGECPSPGAPFRIGIVVPCRPDCRCKKNYWRKNGTCVPYEQCNNTEPQCSKPNESLKCVRECPPEKSCINKDIKFSCLQNNKKCQLKCVCNDGYYRNEIGQCATREFCDRCPGLNEYFSCGGACDNVCKTLHIQSQKNCPIRNIKCNDMCYCKEGYARDDNNNCVPFKECPPSLVCGPHEEYQQCKKTCLPDTCLSLVAKFKCDERNSTCTPGCVCESGYLRQEAGEKCKPICECKELENSPDCS